MLLTTLIKITPGPGEEPTVQSVPHIEKGKPALFIFEGAGAFHEDYPRRDDNKYLARFAKHIARQSPDVNIYTIQSQFYDCLPNTTGAYNADPLNFCTPIIKELTNEVILEGITNISKLSATERHKATEATKATLSRQCALGYSMGGAMIQEIVTGLRDNLKERGFTPAETKDCIRYFSGGTIASAATLIEKEINAPQLHSFLAGDGVVKTRNGSNLVTSGDPSPHPNINGQEYGNNLAVVGDPVIPEGDNIVRTYASKLVPVRKPAPLKGYGTPKERPSAPCTIANPVPRKGEAPNPQWALEHCLRWPYNDHDLYLNTNVDRIVRKDLSTYGFNPAANIFCEGMRRLVDNAVIGYGNPGYSPPEATVKCVKQEFLSPEGKKKSMAVVQKSIERYQADAEWIKAQLAVSP